MLLQIWCINHLHWNHKEYLFKRLMYDFPVAQTVKNLPAMQEPRVRSLGWEVPLAVFLPGEFHGQRSLAGCSPRGHKESDTTERLPHTTHTHGPHLKTPGRVLRPGALGRPRGIRWIGRWEGGSGWGMHVNPWLIHVNVWQNPLQYCKVISLQLIKNKLGKKKIKPWVRISGHGSQMSTF